MRGYAYILLAVVGLVSPLAGAEAKNDALADGRRALMQGRISDALTQFHALVATNPQNGQAHLLLCRTYYAERNADAAVNECEAAIQTLGKSSEAQDWMGKAYGMKAEHAGPLTGYSLAKKVKASFEAAVSLDPANGEAIDDLGDYYVEAPSIVGGGLDKARALAERIKSTDRVLRLQASIAEKEKDFGSAERALKEHVRLSKGRADTWFDLAGFYQRRGRVDEAVDALRHAQAAAHNSGSILVGIADMLDKMQREPGLVTSNLQAYLSSGNTDDSAPTFRAHVLLGKLAAVRGDKAGARAEFQKALALAPDYEPAKKALASL